MENHPSALLAIGLLDPVTDPVRPPGSAQPPVPRPADPVAAQIREPSPCPATLVEVRATGDFRVATFEAAALQPPPQAIATQLPVGVAVMEKRYNGEVSGRSATIFTSAFDQSLGDGTYVAMESFEGSLNGLEGTFNFVHAATTSGSDRTHEHFLIVPSSGTGDLASIRGSGGIAIDSEGRHEIWFEYELD